MGVTSFVHTGVVVEDLAAVVKFLTALGFQCGDSMIVGGEWSSGSSTCRIRASRR